METNSIIDYLTYLFEKYTFEEINEENNSELCDFFRSVLDNSNNFVFSEILWYNFLFLIKTKQNISFYLNMLIEEAEKKSLRVFYDAIIQSEKLYNNQECIRQCDDEKNIFKRREKRQWDEKGRLHRCAYRVDQDNKLHDLVDDKLEVDSLRLSAPVMTKIYEDNIKISENEL